MCSLAEQVARFRPLGAIACGRSGTHDETVDSKPSRRAFSPLTNRPARAAHAPALPRGALAPGWRHHQRGPLRRREGPQPEGI